MLGQTSGKESLTQAGWLDTFTEWPSNRLRLCQQKADEVTYGMKVVALKHNNLGNRGPDTGAHEMRFAVEVTTPNAPVQSLDFIVTNTSFYLPFNIGNNKLSPGDKEYFQINVWEGGNTEIEFKGTFVESDTNKEVKMKDIYVTVYDIDQQNTERIERFFAKDFFKYSVSQTSALNIQQDGEWTVFRPPPTQVGGVPFNPYSLSPAALDQSILLHYRETSSFSFKTSVAGPMIQSGRNYMLAIHSALTECPNGFVCDIFGDPHISSFDNAKPVLLDDEPETLQMNTFDNMALARDDFHDGDMWLIKSKHVLIQGRYGKAKGTDKSFLKAVAIGGPFLHNNTLVLASGARSILWNQQEILTSLGNTHVVQFGDGSEMKASYKSGVRHIHAANQTTDGVEVELPMNIKIFLNRFKTWLGLRIHLHEPIEGGQDGECGNINGNADDDSQLMVERRMKTRVSQNETLFVGRYAMHRPPQQQQEEAEEAPSQHLGAAAAASEDSDDTKSAEAFVSEHDAADDDSEADEADDAPAMDEADEGPAMEEQDSSDSPMDAEAVGTEDDVLAAQDEALNLPQPDDEMIELTTGQDANGASEQTAGSVASGPAAPAVAHAHLLPRVVGRPSEQVLVSEQDAAESTDMQAVANTADTDDSSSEEAKSISAENVENLGEGTRTEEATYADYYTSSPADGSHVNEEQTSDAEEVAEYGSYY